MAEEKKEERSEKRSFLGNFINEMGQWFGVGALLLGRERGQNTGGSSTSDGVMSELEDRIPSFSPEEKFRWNELSESMDSVAQARLAQFMDEAASKGWDRNAIKHQAQVNLKHAWVKKITTQNSAIRKTLQQVADAHGNYEEQEKIAERNDLLIKLKGIRWAYENKSAFLGRIVFVALAIIAVILLLGHLSN